MRRAVLASGCGGAGARIGPRAGAGRARIDPAARVRRSQARHACAAAQRRGPSRRRSSPAVQPPSGQRSRWSSRCPRAPAEPRLRCPTSQASCPRFEQLEGMSTDELDELLGLKPKVDIPAGARRSLERVGVLAPAEGGLPHFSLANQPASLVRAALGGHDAARCFALGPHPAAPRAGQPPRRARREWTRSNSPRCGSRLLNCDGRIRRCARGGAGRRYRATGPRARRSPRSMPTRHRRPRRGVPGGAAAGQRARGRQLAAAAGRSAAPIAGEGARAKTDLDRVREPRPGRRHRRAAGAALRRARRAKGAAR